MCNLYRMNASAGEVAKLLGVEPPVGLNAGSEIYPGYPGIVVTDGQVQQMVWGFPLVLKGKQGQPLKPKPVNNTRTDKLSSSFWKPSFIARRCLIPITSFAEAEGPKGSKTRTWFRVPDTEIFCAAGIWRDSAEWGPSYSMIMTDANEVVSTFHDRMPVLLGGDGYADWLKGDADTAFEMCRPFEGNLLVERTDEPWVRRSS